MAQQSARTRPFPESKNLLSGDFIWPKKPDVYVPYNAGRDATYDQEKVEWEKEKRRFIEQIRKDPKSSAEMSEAAKQLENLDFLEFLARYQGDQKPGVPDSFGAGYPIYVGHVGIVYHDKNGEPSVVEALWGKGVVTTTYENWLKGRPGELVWHGRVRDYRDGERARIADYALAYINRPYNFWNFNLADESGFYCSKLTWLATIKALNFALDGKISPNRAFWLSPKQLMKSDSIYLLNDPGTYALPIN